jgi:hypothetical protein
MLTSLNMKTLGQGAAALALLCGVVFSVNSVSAGSTQRGDSFIETIVFDRTHPTTADEGQVRSAVEAFIRGMKRADADEVWMFAGEEDQAAFQTEPALYAAFADAFPEFTRTQEVRFNKFWREGDTPFVQISLKDTDGNRYQAKLGMWRDDAGDWELVSCEVLPITDRVATL